nr:RNA ligase [Jiella sp. LLJ827]
MPHIAGDNGIYVSKYATHDTIDYGHHLDETFNSAIRRECRGLKFNKSGRLIARPFHKFFNLGERERVEDVDWSRPHRILEKLDGTMIHPAFVESEMVLMTRKGITRQALEAASYATEGLLALARDRLDVGKTAIFEFTSPGSRIVIGYDKPALTLLAIRDNTTGAYADFELMHDMAGHYGVPVVSSHRVDGSTPTFVSGVRGLTEIEGYVIVFDDGHRLKLKTDYYALRHKTLASLALEKNALDRVLKDAVDDVVPLLPPAAAQKLLAYQVAVLAGVSRLDTHVAELLELYRSADRKTQAQVINEKLDKRLRPVAFKSLDGKSSRNAILDILRWASHSQTRIDAVRDLFAMSWNGEDFEIEDGWSDEKESDCLRRTA